MLTTEEVNVLGNITNSTWGISSTPLKVPTMSIKCTLMGEDLMKILYTTVGTFASESAMSQQVDALENDAVQATDKYLKELKKTFKEETGRALKTKVVTAQPTIEIVSLQPHISPKRTAYYKYITVLEME